MPMRGALVTLSAAFQADAPPGLAGRWLIERLRRRRLDARHVSGALPRIDNAVDDRTV
jgi:hypothetical protein